MYREVRPFIEQECRNLRKLKHITLSILLLVDVLLLTFFIYVFYGAYQDRGLQMSFLAYSFKTIFIIQIILSLAFVPLMWMIHSRFQFILFEIKDLKDEYAVLYKEYCNYVPRFFAMLPQYLLSQKGLLVFKNRKRIIFKPDSIQKISIRRINLGRFGKKCNVYIYQNNNLATSLSYASLYPAEVEFLKQHIRLINRSITIEDETEMTN